MSREEATVSFSMELNVEPAYTEIRKFQSVFNKALSLTERMFGDPNLTSAIGKMQNAIRIANELRLTLAALQAARAAAGDPLAWLQFAVTGGTFVYDVSTELGSH